jgi:hypothetical protein
MYRADPRAAVDPIRAAVQIGIVVVVVIALLLWRRRRRQLQLGEIALLPARVVNPRQFAHLKRIRVWELKVEIPEKACAWARESSQHRFRGDVAIPVPIAGCGKRCQCRYLPVTENRKRRRRMDPIDQPELDLSSGGDDRRHSLGRRRGDQWSGDQR